MRNKAPSSKSQVPNLPAGRQAQRIILFFLLGLGTCFLGRAFRPCAAFSFSVLPPLGEPEGDLELEGTA